MHKLRRNFESERKANRNNFYNSIIRNDLNSDAMSDKYTSNIPDNVTEVKPRWNKNMIGKFEVSL